MTTQMNVLQIVDTESKITPPKSYPTICYLIYKIRLDQIISKLPLNSNYFGGTMGSNASYL